MYCMFHFAWGMTVTELWKTTAGRKGRWVSYHHRGRHHHHYHHRYCYVIIIKFKAIILVMVIIIVIIHYHYHYHCHRHRCYYQPHDQNNKYCIEMECVIRICNCERKIPSLTSEVWTNFHSLSNDRQIWSLHLFFSLRRTSLKVTISIFFVSSNNILIYAKLANNYIKSLVSGSSLKQLVLP